MSEENLEIVHRIYCRTLKLDPDLLAGLEEFATSDTVFDFTETYPDGDVVRGLEGVRGIASNWPWEPLHFDPERFLEVDGRRVLVFVRATATGRGSGVAVERRTAHECTFSDGSLVRFKVYSDREGALEAAGLPGVALVASTRRPSDERLGSHRRMPGRPPARPTR